MIGEGKEVGVDRSFRLITNVGSLVAMRHKSRPLTTIVSRGWRIERSEFSPLKSVKNGGRPQVMSGMAYEACRCVT